MEETMSHKSAVEHYRSEVQPLGVYRKPNKRYSRFGRGAWLLNDRDGLVAIVPGNGAPPVRRQTVARKGCALRATKTTPLAREGDHKFTFKMCTTSQIRKQRSAKRVNTCEDKALHRELARRSPCLENQTAKREGHAGQWWTD
ncbi:MAG: hypothetical protein PVI91_14305 [Gammaproteobacteria bacterium]|jgi:hypothetical protein